VARAKAEVKHVREVDPDRDYVSATEVAGWLAYLRSRGWTDDDFPQEWRSRSVTGVYRRSRLYGA
jgi:hypothetical protein